KSPDSLPARNSKTESQASSTAYIFVSDWKRASNRFFFGNQLRSRQDARAGHSLPTAAPTANLVVLRRALPVPGAGNRRMKLPMPSPLARDGDLSVAIPAGPGKSRARPAPPPAHPGAPTKEPAIDALSVRLDPTQSPGAPRWLPRERDRGGPAACPAECG